MLIIAVLCVAGLAAASIEPLPRHIWEPDWDLTWSDKLKLAIQVNYDKKARPAQHTNATQVEFDVLINHVDVDAIDSRMSIQALTQMHWIDEKLKWTPSEYGGVDSLLVDVDEIWQPDVLLYNSANGNTAINFGRTQLTVLHTGQVIWVSPSEFTVFCEIDLSKWPYDKQTCHFHFGSWVHNGTQIVFKKKSNRTLIQEDERVVHPMHWTVLSKEEVEHKKHYRYCPEPYYSIELDVKVERKSPQYAPLIIFPAIVCVLLTLVVFWLPPLAPQKFLVAGVAVIVVTMFLVFFAERVYVLGLHMPLLVEFYVYNLVLVGLSMVSSVLSLNLSRGLSARPVPWVVSKALRSPPAVLLCIYNSNNALQSMEDNQDCEELHDRSHTEAAKHDIPQSSANIAREWALVASALDRLMFILYLVIFLMIAATLYIP